MNWIFEKLSQLQNRFFYSKTETSPEETVEETQEIDLSTLRVVDLRALASEKNLTGFSKLNKADLIELLNKN